MAVGLEPEDVEVDPVEVWPENWPAIELFQKVGTQWRVGMGGATGLDYGVLMRLMDRMDLPPDEWDELFDSIRVLESAALEVMREQKD